MTLIDQLLMHLADGKFHSGKSLGERFGVSRTAIWQYIKKCQQRGVTIHAVRGRGYCIPGGLDLLSHSALEKHLSNESVELEIFSTLPSTNSYLMELAKTPQQYPRVCLAEQQTAGKGRRGRQWFSPFGNNLYLSILQQFDGTPGQLAGLSLATGVAVVQALEAQGLKNCRLKWPNDVLCQGKKLAGILVEVLGDTQGPCQVVIGLGVNLALRTEASAVIHQPFTSAAAQGVHVDRNHCAALLITSCLQAFNDYQKQGLAVFRSEWERLDAYLGQRVQLQWGKTTRQGQYVGIDEQGSLLLAHSGRTECFSSGEVSLRGDH